VTTVRLNAEEKDCAGEWNSNTARTASDEKFA
jgi:hypothetical protein